MTEECKHYQYQVRHDNMGWMCWCLECGEKSLHYSSKMMAIDQWNRQRYNHLGVKKDE